jgi:tRNA (guanine-N7-)-methyltransferase
MSKRKLERYSAIQDLDNVIELENYSPDTICAHRGKWGETIFGNDNPIVLELACGKGDYSLELAQRYPHKNFIGVDIKGDRIWKGAVRAKEAGLPNVRFLRIYIDHICNYFADGEVSEIWITFPDPYLAERKILKRLTSPVFVDRYRKVLQQGGKVHLKTDSPELFEYTEEIVSELNLPVEVIVRDVHGSNHCEPDLDILTYYELMHLEDNRTIQYIRYLVHVE